jgi:cell division protein FtsB
MCDYTTMCIYKILTDLGSFISGVLALFVGAVIVIVTAWAAKRQIAATETAAEKQIATMRATASDQVNEMRAQLARSIADNRERDSRQVRNAMRLISIEAQRLKLMAAHRHAICINKVGEWVRSSEYPADVFKIYTTGVLRDAAGATALLGQPLLNSMTRLVASVDQMNSTIETQLFTGILKWSDLRAEFEGISERADELEAQLGIFENAEH